jgi:hypothetical protein
MASFEVYHYVGIGAKMTSVFKNSGKIMFVFACRKHLELVLYLYETTKSRIWKAEMVFLLKDK